MTRYSSMAPLVAVVMAAALLSTSCSSRSTCDGSHASLFLVQSGSSCRRHAVKGAVSLTDLRYIAFHMKGIVQG